MSPRHVDRSDDDDVVPSDGRDETPNERSDRHWNDILQELRVALTGTQLIGGFLLAVAFQQRFTELDAYQLTLYLTLVALAGLATVVGLAPVTLHRTLFGRRVKGRVVRIGGVETNDVLEHGKLPDPEGQAIDDLAVRIEQMEAQVRALAEERQGSVAEKRC